MKAPDEASAPFEKEGDCSRKCNLAALHSGPHHMTPVNAGNCGGLEASGERYTKISDFRAFEQPKKGCGKRPSWRHWPEMGRNEAK